MIATGRIYKRCAGTGARLGSGNHLFSSSTAAHIKSVIHLADWTLDEFRQRAFLPQSPAKLPYDGTKVPKAFTKWFTHDHSSSREFDDQPHSSELRREFWSQHEEIMVPLELTRRAITNESASAGQQQESRFHRSEAPLKVLLTHLDNSDQEQKSRSTCDDADHYSIYLAQCEIGTLPRKLQDDLDTPEIVKSGGQGDLYSSSLWLGRPPTYTPLHRDPNPNLLMQLAGQKVIRLLPPEVGTLIFDWVQDRLVEIRKANTQTQQNTDLFLHRQVPVSPSFRGDEMMQGPERELFHDIIWGTDTDTDTDTDNNEASNSMNTTTTNPTNQPHPANSNHNNNNNNNKKKKNTSSNVHHESSDESQKKPERKSNRSNQNQQQIIDHYTLEAHLNPGEALFIPKGWWHSVKGVVADGVGVGRIGVTASANWWFR